MENPIYVALDTTDIERAEEIASRVRASVGGLKLGLEFFLAHGAEGVRRVGRLGLPLFLDLKLHDIPNTVARAIRALRGLDLAILNVHAAGGRAMLEAAAAARPEGTKLIAVTVLTSLDEADLRTMGIAIPPAEEALRLALLCREAELDGVVCSAHEVRALKRAWADGLYVVPGIRPAGSAVGDQKRVMTPAEAMAAGAGILVIGRPITAAPDPGAAAAAIAASLQPGGAGA